VFGFVQARTLPAGIRPIESKVKLYVGPAHDSVSGYLKLVMRPSVSYALVASSVTEPTLNFFEVICPGEV
jgi:hypothetical protein